jgi:hypothetical protein
MGPPDESLAEVLAAGGSPLMGSPLVRQIARVVFEAPNVAEEAPFAELLEATNQVCRVLTTMASFETRRLGRQRLHRFRMSARGIVTVSFIEPQEPLFRALVREDERRRTQSSRR